MASRRNVFSRQGGCSPRTFKKQVSLRNAFKQGGSIRNLFQSPKSAGSKDTNGDTKRKPHALLHSLKEHMQQQHPDDSELGLGMGKSEHTKHTQTTLKRSNQSKSNNNNNNKNNNSSSRRRRRESVTTSGAVATSGAFKNSESGSSHKKKGKTKDKTKKQKKKTRKTRTKKTKEAVPVSPDSSEGTQSKHWWQKNPEENPSKHGKSKSKSKRGGSKSSRRATRTALQEDSNNNNGAAMIPMSPKISPKTFKKCVMVDMCGTVDLDATGNSYTNHTAQTDQTHTDTTHATMSLDCENYAHSPKALVVRKISSDNGVYSLTPKKIPEDGYPSEDGDQQSSEDLSSPTGTHKSTGVQSRDSHITTDDDVSILSEAEFSDQIMEDLSCALEDTESDDIVEEEDDIYEEEIIEEYYDYDDEEEEEEEEVRSYVDLYCPTMKRISDLTGATGHVTMSSEMYDEECEVPPPPPRRGSQQETASPVTPISRSSVHVANRGKGMSRISELTEGSMFDDLDIFDEDDEYDCSSIVSEEESASFVKDRKPMSYYSTSGHERCGNCGVASPGTPTNCSNSNSNNKRISVRSDSSGSFVKDRKPMAFYSMSGREDIHTKAVNRANATWNESFSYSQPSPASTYRTYNQTISDLSSYSTSFSSTPVNRKAPHRVSWKEEDSSFEEYSIDIASLDSESK